MKVLRLIWKYDGAGDPSGSREENTVVAR
jgi:hypothetical protein